MGQRKSEAGERDRMMTRRLKKSKGAWATVAFRRRVSRSELGWVLRNGKVLGKTGLRV